jgi:hypothetical protein
VHLLGRLMKHGRLVQGEANVANQELAQPAKRRLPGVFFSVRLGSVATASKAYESAKLSIRIVQAPPAASQVFKHGLVLWKAREDGEVIGIVAGVSRGGRWARRTTWPFPLVAAAGDRPRVCLLLLG